MTKLFRSHELPWLHNTHKIFELTNSGEISELGDDIYNVDIKNKKFYDNKKGFIDLMFNTIGLTENITYEELCTLLQLDNQMDSMKLLKEKFSFDVYLLKGFFLWLDKKTFNMAFYSLLYNKTNEEIIQMTELIKNAVKILIHTVFLKMTTDTVEFNQIHAIAQQIRPQKSGKYIGSGISSKKYDWILSSDWSIDSVNQSKSGGGKKTKKIRKIRKTNNTKTKRVKKCKKM
jgi:hypothetical protein